jgi:hypothetical protein
MVRNRPPVRQDVGPGLVEKWQFLRPHILPALQLSTSRSTCVAPLNNVCHTWNRKCLDGPRWRFQPGGTSGTALPTLRSVKTAGHIVKGHALYTANVREMTIGIRVRTKESLIYMVDTVLREYKEMSDFLCQNAANSVDFSCFFMAIVRSWDCGWIKDNLL